MPVYRTRKSTPVHKSVNSNWLNKLFIRNIL